MKKRIIWKMFVLQIVTLGIYRLYFFVQTRKEMMAANKSIKIKSPWLFIAPFLLIPAVIITLIAVTFINTNNKTTNPSCIQQNNSASVDYSLQDSKPDQTNVINDICIADNKKSSLVATFMPLILYVLFIGTFILYVVWVWSYAQGVDTITKGKINFALALVVLIIVPDGIDLLIIQDAFNKIPSKRTVKNH
jgi:hypothetical protein